MRKTIVNYFSKHVSFNSTTHFLIGLGLGILVNPWTGTHPIRWGVGLLVLGLLMHVYPLFNKK